MVGQRRCFVRCLALLWPCFLVLLLLVLRSVRVAWVGWFVHLSMPVLGLFYLLLLCRSRSLVGLQVGGLVGQGGLCSVVGSGRFGLFLFPFCASWFGGGLWVPAFFCGMVPEPYRWEITRGEILKLAGLKPERTYRIWGKLWRLPSISLSLLREV